MPAHYKHNRWWIPAVSVCILAFFLTLSSRTDALEEDAIWTKTTTLSARSMSMVPKQVTENEEIYNMEGKLEEVTNTVIRVSGPHQSLRFSLEHVNKNKAPLPAAERRVLSRVIQGMKRTDVLPEVLYLFDPTNRQRLTILRRESELIIKGVKCSGFIFRFISPNNTWNGTAWVQSNTGQPILVSCKPDTPTGGDRHTRVLTVDYSILYGNIGGVEGIPLKIFSTARFVYRPLPLVNYRGKARTTTTFEY